MVDPRNFNYESQNIMNSPDLYLSSSDELVMNLSSEYYTLSSQISNPKQEVISSSSISSSSFFSSHLISFGNSNEQNDREIAPEGSCLIYKSSEINKVPNSPKLVNRVGSTSRCPASYFNEEHVLAERKRREKLNQQFVALSSAIPDLKKMDKASVLEDAIKYVKHLEERVKRLEQDTTQRTIESVVFVKKTSARISSDDYSEQCSTTQLPEIEAIVSDKDVLIRIHFEKKEKQGDQAMSLVNIIAQIEKLNLTILNTSVLPLGIYTVYLTVIAQMDVDYCMEAKDLVENLKEALRNNSIS